MRKGPLGRWMPLVLLWVLNCPDGSEIQLPVFPEQRTSSDRLGKSQTGHEPTSPGVLLDGGVLGGLWSGSVVGATNSRSVTLYRFLQDLLRARLNKALPMVAIHAIKCEGH
jgi:hypothetical protein